MNKVTSGMILAVIIYFFPALALANSGPVYWYGHPSSDIMLIEANSPIKIESENLVFDFSDSEKFSDTINGKVTATYEMFNPTDEVQSVEMVFPFVERLDSFSKDDIVITANNSELSYDIYIGDVVNSYGDPLQVDKEASFDFNKIVSTITNDLYEARDFNEKEKGKLYTIEVKPTTDERINFVVNFEYDSNKTKVLTNSFNSYGYDGKTTEITAWSYEPVILEIFVLGEDIDLNIDTFTDGEQKQKTDLLSYETATDELGIKAYLMDYLKNNPNELYNGLISDTQLYNLYAKAFDDYSTRNTGYINLYDLIEQANYERILSLVYTVSFPENSRKKVSVSYRTSGTMDKTETADPLYTFDYILNPAKNWRDFKNLTIKIIPPEQAPHIIKSNIKLDKEENNVHIASFEKLPDDDLTFTLYANEKITLIDKLEGKSQKKFWYFTPFVFGAIVLIIIGVVIWIARRNNYPFREYRKGGVKYKWRQN